MCFGSEVCAAKWGGIAAPEQGAQAKAANRLVYSGDGMGVNGGLIVANGRVDHSFGKNKKAWKKLPGDEPSYTLAVRFPPISETVRDACEQSA